MSLQVWLPLNGNLNNQGLDPVNFAYNTGATVNANGKLGSCYYFNGTSHWIRASFDKTQYSGKPISLACWFKCNKVHTPGNIIDLAADLCLGYTYTENSGLKFYCWRCYDAGGRTGRSVSTSTFYNADVWHHITATLLLGVTTIYVDGVESIKVDNSQYYDYNWTPLLGAAYYQISCGKSGGDQNWAGGWLNDVRIYDHALSEKEVQEIAKGLAVHYKLDSRFFEATTNLCSSLVKGGRTTVTNNIITNTGENADTYWYIKPKEALIGGTTYTVSCYLSGFSSNTTYISWGVGAQSGTNCAGYWQCYNGFNQFTFTMPSGLNGSTANIIFDDNGGTRTEQFTISQVQLEQKDHATGFVDYGKTREAGLIYDCSGYQNNATNVNCTISTDTAKYSASIAQTAGQYIRSLGRPNDFLPHDAITVNLWMKCTTWGNPISCTESGGFNFEYAGSGIRFPIHITHSSGNSYAVAQSTITPSTLLNDWHMVTGTFDGTNTIIYIDGEEAGRTTAYSGTIHYYNNYLFIGAEAQGNDTTPTNSTFVGNISDVRIYATALSAEDILELYQTSGSIDNQGNAYAREVIE